MQSFTIIAILGMHRSGTSLAANVIQSFGVPMGQSLLPANEYNKWGYFEDTEVVKIHNQLLTDLQRPWGSVRHTFPLPQDWLTSKAAGKAKKALLEYLKTEIAQHKETGLWGVKDPRISLFLPLWTQIAEDLGVRLKAILCFRNVESVAASLLERDHLPSDAGRLLWLQYCAQAVSHVDPEATHVVRFENWQDKAGAVSKGMREFCGIDESSAASPPFHPGHARTLSNLPEGVFADWTKEIEKTDTDHKLSAKLLTLARDYLDYVQVSRIWPRYLDDEVVQKRMSARLEQDLEVYRRAHDKLSEESAVLAKQAADRLTDAQEDASKMREAYEALADTAASHQKAYEASQGVIETLTAQLSEAHQQHRQSVADGEAYRDALGAVRMERDKLLAAAEENLTAYQTVDNWLSVTKETLASTDKELKELQEKYSEQAQLLQVVSAQIEAEQQKYGSLAEAHKTLQETDAAKLEATAQTISNLQAERDALLRTAQDNLQAYKTVDEWLLDARAKIDDMKRWHIPSMAQQITQILKKPS